MNNTRPSFKKHALIALLFLCYVFSTKAFVKFDIFSVNLINRVEQEYGDDAKERVTRWRDIVSEYQSDTEKEKLHTVNRFFNQLRFVDDVRVWGQKDYWATPVEFLGKNAGDCEDFSIAKYFTLTALGVPKEKLRLMYVQALSIKQAHMVLAYFETPDAMPLLLDNLNKRILPANLRRDLKPVYSFNGDGLWVAKAQGRGKKLRNSGHSMWENMLTRIEQGK